MPTSDALLVKPVAASADGAAVDADIMYNLQFGFLGSDGGAAHVVPAHRQARDLLTEIQQLRAHCKP